MTECNRQVNASNNDAYRKLVANNFSLVRTNGYTGYYNSENYKCGQGFRFTNITIPKGSGIIHAYLKVCGHTNCPTLCGGIVARSRVRGENSVNPSVFSTEADFDTRRANIIAQIDWDNIPPFNYGVWYPSPDIQSIIQALVNLGEWISGNAIVIFWDDWEDRSDHNPYAGRYYHSWDGSVTVCAKLEIEYVGAVLPTVTTQDATGIGRD